MPEGFCGFRFSELIFSVDKKSEHFKIKCAKRILHRNSGCKMSKKLVAVIGAGGAGLAMCRYLTNESNIDFVVFEKAHEIGGIWRYTKGGGELEKNEEHGTAMYKNLRYYMRLH